MGNVLSQDEVDSLLGGISDGKIETEKDVPEKSEEIKTYDFSMPAGSIHLRMPALGIINERLIGFLRTSLPVASKSVIDVNLSSVETVRFSEFCLSLPVPTSLNIFSLEPLKGHSLLVMEGPLVFAFVDSLFGGKGVSPVKLEGRGFTKIETKIVEKIVKIILGDLQQAWSDVYEVKAIFSHSEMDPQFARIVTPEDLVIVIKFEIQLENESGTITICIPFSSIEPIEDRFQSGFQDESQKPDQKWRKYFEKKIMEMTVEMSCTMGVAKIKGQELLKMKVDDVILLDQKIGDFVIVNVESIPKFNGHPGSLNNRKAVRISEIISKE
jgi:flagellar motor switch protein FliM